MATTDISKSKEIGVRITRYDGLDANGEPIYTNLTAGEIALASGVTLFRNSVPKNKWDKIVAEAGERLGTRGFSEHERNDAMGDGLVRFVKSRGVKPEDFFSALAGSNATAGAEPEDEDDLPF